MLVVSCCVSSFVLTVMQLLHVSGHGKAVLRPHGLGYCTRQGGQSRVLLHVCKPSKQLSSMLCSKSVHVLSSFMLKFTYDAAD